MDLRLVTAMRGRKPRSSRLAGSCVACADVGRAGAVFSNGDAGRLRFGLAFVLHLFTSRFWPGSASAFSHGAGAAVQGSAQVQFWLYRSSGDG